MQCIVYWGPKVQARRGPQPPSADPGSGDKYFFLYCRAVVRIDCDFVFANTQSFLHFVNI